MRAGWLTDIHLNFVPQAQRQEFYARLRSQPLDGLMIGGNIGEAASVAGLLAEIEEAVPAPIYFVLGNHDFYGGSIRGVREVITQQAKRSANLHYLTALRVIPLGASTALIGHDGWADG